MSNHSRSEERHADECLIGWTIFHENNGDANLLGIVSPNLRNRCRSM